MDAVARTLPPAARVLMAAFFPGPVTLIVPRLDTLAPAVSAGLGTVGLRVPAHPVAQAFLEHCGCPVAAPSANRSGRPSPTTWQAVRDDLDGRIDCILQGPRSSEGLESTVVDVTGTAPLVLRAGAVSLEALQAAVPATRLAHSAAELARSPGTRHRHYAPDAPVRLVDAPPTQDTDGAAFIGLDAPAAPERFRLVSVCPDVAAYAYRLFDFLRRSDAAGASPIYCQRVPAEGLGRALMDRLERAAQG